MISQEAEQLGLRRTCTSASGIACTQITQMQLSSPCAFGSAQAFAQQMILSKELA
jgi:hypothetical protein